MDKKCEICGKRIRNKRGRKKYCGSISRKQGCAYEEYINREKPLKKKIQSLYQYSEWRLNVLRHYNYFCQDCGIKGRQRSVLIFPDLPVLYVIHIKLFDDIIKEEKIISEKDALLCDKLWSISNGKIVCVNCYDKLHKTSLRKTEKKLLKYARLPKI